MTACERRTERRHGIVKSCLMQCNHIHISLAQEQLRLFCRPCEIESVKIAALVEYLRLGGIEILWLSISHDAPAKSDHLIVHIHDRKHGTVPELIMSAPHLIDRDKTGIL